MSAWFVPGNALRYLIRKKQNKAHEAPLYMEFSRQAYWSGLPLPTQGIFPTQGSNPGPLHCRQILYHLSYQGSPLSGFTHIVLFKSLTSSDFQMRLSLET